MDKSLMDDTTFINFFGKPENIYAMEYFLECYLNLEEGSLKDQFQQKKKIINLKRIEWISY